MKLLAIAITLEAIENLECESLKTKATHGRQNCALTLGTTFVIVLPLT